MTGEGKVSGTSEQFDSCYNHIINNDFPRALESFKAAYREHPDAREYLHGMIISYVFLDRIDELKACLDSEKNVSSYGAIVSRILGFIRKNDFSGLKAPDKLYNIAVFVSRRVSATDAKLYFTTGLLMGPHDPRYLAAVAEYNIIEGNYEKGISFYSQAADRK